MIDSQVPGLDAQDLESRARQKLESLPQNRQRRGFSLQLEVRDLLNDEPVEVQHVSELYMFEGELFVKQVFRNVLRREADQEALAHYLGELRVGIAKPDIIARLSLSREGRSRSMDIKGLNSVRARFLLRKIPIVSHLLEGVWNLLTLPRYIRYLRARELQLYSLIVENNQHSQTLAKGLSQSNRGLEEKIREVSTVTDLKLDRQDFLAERSRVDLSVKRLIQDYQEAHSRLQRELNRLARQAPRVDDSVQPNSTPPTAGKSSQFENFYVAFEDKFRGSEKTVTESFENYLPYLDQLDSDSNCLDIGCGRGEWLALLASRGVRGKGIDLNTTMAEECRSKGLDVEAIDLGTYLSRCVDDTFDLVTAFHVVEHLEFDVLLGLFDEALRTLKPGGRIIFETPNPANLLVGTNNFYLDPTHRNPLPSEMLRFVAEHRGYQKVEIVNLHPVRNIENRAGYSTLELDMLDRLYGPQDYAVVGLK